jgi:transposase
MVASMNKELSRLDVLLDLEAGRITIREAGERMGLSHRQVFRLVKAFRQRGAASLVSCRRGRPSNNRLPAAVRDLAMAIVKERYADFGPTLAAEKLAEVHGCRVSRETLRKWMVEDCGYARGLRSIQRYWTRTYPAPSVRARRAAFEWMRAILQKEICPDVLRREVGDIPDFPVLLHRLYDGRLSDRNRSMVILANHHGLSGGVVCAFLGIQKKTQRKYLQMFEAGGQAALFARQTKSTRKFDNEAVKQAVFGVLHEPPSNYGINRTTWIMPDLGVEPQQVVLGKSEAADGRF